jgi:hypothetical protein
VFNNPWKAALQDKMPGQNFRTERVQHGSQSYPPGDTQVSGVFCYQIAPGTNTVRVEFTPDSTDARCNPHAKSVSIPPCSVVCSQSPVYTDVPTDSPFYSEIGFFGSEGIVSGYSDGTFRPSGTATRGQVAKILALAFGVRVDNLDTPSIHFSDVTPDNPFYAYVEAAAARGWISGYSDGTFRPYANVTRAQVAKMVVIAAGYKPISPATPSFSDVPVGSAFYSYIETARANDILSGYDDGTFRPEAQATRGQICKAVDLAAFPPQD